MCLSRFCQVRGTSLSSQSHLTYFRVESRELSSHFESLVCKLESMSSHTNFHVFSMTFFYYEMAPDQLEIVPNVVLTRFDCRLFISKFIVIAFYLSHSLFSHFKKSSPTMMQVLQPLS